MAWEHQQNRTGRQMLVVAADRAETCAPSFGIAAPGMAVLRGASTLVRAAKVLRC